MNIALLVSLIIGLIVMLSFVMRPILKQRNLTEVLLFSILLAVTGGLLIENDNPINIIAFVLLGIGFLSGIAAFIFKTK